MNFLQRLLDPNQGKGGYGPNLLHSPQDFLRHAANSFTNDVVLAPRHALAELAQNTSGAHPLPPGGRWLGPNLIQPLKMRPMMSLYGGPPSAPLLPPPQFMAHNSYGGLQPNATGEDDYTPIQALQPTGYSNQATLNGQFTQGPMASLYRLRGY